MEEKFKIRLDEIQETYKKETRKVLLELAKENNPYKVEDILKDHHTIGKVKTVVFSIDHLHREYEIFYKCDRLTQKLIPFKNNESIDIFLRNVKEKLN